MRVMNHREVAIVLHALRTLQGFWILAITIWID